MVKADGSWCFVSLPLLEAYHCCDGIIKRSGSSILASLVCSLPVLHNTVVSLGKGSLSMQTSSGKIASTLYLHLIHQVCFILS